MVDQVTTVPRARITRTVGRLEDDLMVRVGRALLLWLGVAA